VHLGARLKDEKTMSKVSLTLDTRKARPSVKLLISAGTVSRRIALSVVLDRKEQWDGEKIVNHPQAAALNAICKGRLIMAMNCQLDLQRRNEDTLDNLMAAIREKLDPEKAEKVEEKRILEHSVENVWTEWLRLKEGNKRTWEMYRTTRKRLQEYCETIGQEWCRLMFEQIDARWVDGWVRYMSRTKGVNGRSIELRNLRAVCNYAYDNEYTEKYIWRKYKIDRCDGEVQPLSVDEWRLVMGFDEQDDAVRMYRDIALLGFMLIGMNIVDMHKVLKTDVVGDYLVYRRSKTGRRYKIKIEPEARALIERYKGDVHLLGFGDRYNDYTSFNQHLNEEGLQRIGPFDLVPVQTTTGLRYRKEWHPLMPSLTYYQLRHTWATFAYNHCHISRETIARCLGHGKKTVTDIYIDYDQKEIDDANRKVLDFALGLLK